jgi:hypothetical protein
MCRLVTSISGRCAYKTIQDKYTGIINTMDTCSMITKYQLEPIQHTIPYLLNPFPLMKCCGQKYFGWTSAAWLHLHDLNSSWLFSMVFRCTWLHASKMAKGLGVKFYSTIIYLNHFYIYLLHLKEIPKLLMCHQMKFQLCFFWTKEDKRPEIILNIMTSHQIVRNCLLTWILGYSIGSCHT